VIHGASLARVVVVDLQPLVSQAVAARLSTRGFSVLAILRSGAEAVAFVTEAGVDVLLLGLPLRGEGLACLRGALAASPGLQVVVCNAPGEGDPETALAEGAAAFVERSGHPDDIVAAIRQVVTRSIFFAQSEHRPAQRRMSAPLTSGERQIAALAGEGATNSSIARQLGVSEQAVRFHLSNIYRKLGVSNRTQMSLQLQLRGVMGTEGRETPKSA
jgi:DNA-binding NarL/FixJ family response regulator